MAGGCGKWVWENFFEGIFKRAYGVGDEVGASGERSMSIMLVRGEWRLGVSALCVGGGR
ncbi:hypothetical protein [Bartonella schoenbuchensis]|uniref:hypothetical protein n=1 Tax=Bartonella schoenbuchensis TaxID=165694 RepID=UPI003144F386